MVMTVTIDIWQLVTVTMVIIVSLAGLLKYLFYLLDRHKEYIDSRFSEHKEKLEQHTCSIQSNHDLVHKVREELYGSYVRGENLEVDFAEMLKKFDQVFTYLTGLSRDVNRLIGKDEAKQ